MSDEEKPQKATSPAAWTTLEKLRVLITAAELEGSDLGEFLRSEGIDKPQLEEWRVAIEARFAKAQKKAKPSPEAKRVKELEKELRRTERALAETTALLVLQRKAQEIWGDENDSADKRSGK